jgi:hypothetical protein
MMELIERVAQADRNAAADILDEISSLTQDDGIGQVADLIRDGEYDEHDTVQRTARHRQAGVQQGLDMAAAYIQAEYPFDKRKLVPAIRKLGGGDA